LLSRRCQFWKKYILRAGRLVVNEKDRRRCASATARSSE
jgi:hypothetical protein